ncbi:hypothetical protein [Flavobacterium agrisoli]|uniref:Uncharacterized protein n=1 Tax=Flavobacterium agrisoli TaxID=2793066 RepID=A0A934PNZ9_9FLAO|nr:hypothetical protein [Flavobacterium agrisoli]MBK0370264.1 hypothetical protein [Flavobacterium agrisoli]
MPKTTIISSIENQSKKVGSAVWVKLFFILVSLFLTFETNAQCAMCRAALGGDANVKQAEAVNDGIVYLMVIPYLLVVVIGYIIYKMYQTKKKKAD